MNCPSRKILRTILKVDEERALTNGPENKKIDTVNKALHRVYVSRKEG